MTRKKIRLWLEAYKYDVWVPTPGTDQPWHDGKLTRADSRVRVVPYDRPKGTTGRWTGGANYQPRTGADMYRALDTWLGAKGYRPGPGHPKTVEVYRLYRNPGQEQIGVRLYSTTVVRVHPNGSIELDWSGWFTQTTNRIINEYLPRDWSVFGTRIPILRAPNGTMYRVTGSLMIGPRGHVTPTDGGRYAWAKPGNYQWYDRARTPYPNGTEPFKFRNWEGYHQYELALRATERKSERDRARAAADREREDAARRAEWVSIRPVRPKTAPGYGWKFLNHERTGPEFRLVSAFDQRSHGWGSGPYWPEPGSWRDDELRAPCVGLNCSTDADSAAGFVNGSVIARVAWAGRYHDDSTNGKITSDSMSILAAWVVRGSSDPTADMYHAPMVREPDLMVDGWAWAPGKLIAPNGRIDDLTPTLPKIGPELNPSLPNG